MKLVARYDGLRMAICLGATAEIVGALLKCLGAVSRKSNAGRVFLHMGQIFSGVGSPVATGCVSALSATWFEPAERTRATAAAVMFNSVGNALCYLFVPSMTNLFSFTGVAVYEVAMGIVSVFFVWFILPQEHEKKDGEEEEKGTKEAVELSPANSVQESIAHDPDLVVPEHKEHEHASLASQVKNLFKMPSVVCLLLVYSWLCGGFSAWISLFAATYNKFYTESFIGIMCFFGMTCYVCGGLVSSILVDLYFTRQMKYVIFFCISVTTLANLIFIACTPNDKGYFLWDLGKGFVVFSTAMCGFWNGAAAPLFFELVAEISFPIEESVSGICISIFENAGALIFYQVVSRVFSGQSMSVAYSFGMTVAVALVALVKQRYNRTYHNYITGNAGE
ncbi:MFS transporter, FLVCR family, disrupted in renal carcinoma protein 2 [Strigomonas culicis]|uniref:MFS transporter, FLVCR family, disrupted in renal carcinoma protein 2 n=1 Tax=Strigomonas culicis TaxID=28005 RepID=S9UUX9_9TRYP|nr:MFS transporter, FLVCR family, disrupted in renal carcinoma protein 2 [Strigomonas culicis]|eukprot:EPY32703.1 MFS transporter, FLVCR family, disrupted in renal carcinoma protein 2 [Strigomonas culicis]